jgi:hypothetical protein
MVSGLPSGPITYFTRSLNCSVIVHSTNNLTTGQTITRLA